MERRERRVQLIGRPRTPEPMGLGMTHLSDGEGEDPHQQHHGHQLHRQWDSTSTSPPPPSSSLHTLVIDELLQRLTALSAQFESAMEVSSSLQTQHAAAQGTIEVLEKVVGLEVLVKAQAIAPSEITPLLLPPSLSNLK